MPTSNLTQVRRFLLESRDRWIKWRVISEHFPGVPLGTLCRIAKDPTYQPKSHTVLVALGVKRVHQPHPVMRRKKIDRAVRRPVVIKGDANGVCATVGDQTFCADTLSDLIDWLTQ